MLRARPVRKLGTTEVIQWEARIDERQGASCGFVDSLFEKIRSDEACRICPTGRYGKETKGFAINGGLMMLLPFWKPRR